MTNDWSPERDLEAAGIVQERIPFDVLEEVLAIFAENEQATSELLN